MTLAAVDGCPVKGKGNEPGRLELDWLEVRWTQAGSSGRKLILDSIIGATEHVPETEDASLDDRTRPTYAGQLLPRVLPWLRRGMGVRFHRNVIAP